MARDVERLAELVTARLSKGDIDPEELPVLQQRRDPLALGCGDSFDHLAHRPTRLRPAQDGALARDEAGETHHIVFRITGGDDPDWASWYSEWLTQHSELPDLLGTKPVRSELTYMLVKLDRDYAEKSPDEPWPDWYAARLIEHFS